MPRNLLCGIFLYTISLLIWDIRHSMSKHQSIEQLRELIYEGEASDPLIFLESVMNGQDPRRFSDVYKLALDIEEFSDGVPSPDEWFDLFEQIRLVCKYKTVTLSESTSAAKTVAEYLHAKRKSLDINTGAEGQTQIEELRESEIKAFLTIYEQEF